MNTHHQDNLGAFDFSSIISAAGTALKAAGPELVKAGLQKRMAEIQAKRAQKIAAAQDRKAAAEMAAQEAALARQEAALAQQSRASQSASLPTPWRAPAAGGALGFMQNMPQWVIPAVIALVVAFLKLRNKKK